MDERIKKQLKEYFSPAEQEEELQAKLDALSAGFKKILREGLADEGFLDLVLLDDNGVALTSGSGLYSQDYSFEQAPYVKPFLAGEPVEGGVLYSSVDYLNAGGDSGDKKNPLVYMARPIMAAALEEGGQKKLLGVMLAPISLTALDDKMRASIVLPQTGMYVAFDSRNLVAFCRDMGFSGASLSESFNLDKFPSLAQTFQKAMDGQPGFTQAGYLDDKTGEKEIQKLVAYASFKLGRDKWHLAVMSEFEKLPALSGLKTRFYIGLAIAAAFILFQYILLLRETYKKHQTSYDQKKLADASAINDILRGVNEELSASKSNFEKRSNKHLEISDQIEQGLKKLNADMKEFRASGGQINPEQTRLLKSMHGQVERIQAELKKLRNL